MVDLHTHILPAVDDGAKDLNESLALIDSLKSQGIDEICLTSHYYPYEMSPEDFIAKRSMAYNRLKSGLENRQIKLVLGAEVQLNDILFNNGDLKDFCIEGTNYMLLELPYTDKFESGLVSKLDKFIDMYGIIPIIAHAERYLPVQKHPHLCAQFKECGCLIQLNCDSVIERGKLNRTVKKLIKNGLCDLLGSDCHNTGARPANFKAATDVLCNNYGYGIIEFFESNAQRVLQNESLIY